MDVSYRPTVWKLDKEIIAVLRRSASLPRNTLPPDVDDDGASAVSIDQDVRSATRDYMRHFPPLTGGDYQSEQFRGDG